MPLSRGCSGACPGHSPRLPPRLPQSQCCFPPLSFSSPTFFLFRPLAFCNLPLATSFRARETVHRKGERQLSQVRTSYTLARLRAVTGKVAAGTVRGSTGGGGPDLSAPACCPPTGNAIQAFGNGTDANMSPKNPSFRPTQAPRAGKAPSLPDDLSDSTSLGTNVITTCTSVQVSGRGSAAGDGDGARAGRGPREAPRPGRQEWGAQVPPFRSGAPEAGRSWQELGVRVVVHEAPTSQAQVRGPSQACGRWHGAQEDGVVPGR